MITDLQKAIAYVNKRIATVNAEISNALSSVSGVTSYNDLTDKPVIPDISGKQDTLVSGTNIKTVNSTSLLGSGDIVISGSGLSQAQVLARNLGC